jgi:hypothetical protein
MKVTFNPLHGCFETVSDSSEQSVSIVITRPCDVGAAIGDIVHEDLVTDDLVTVNTDNTIVAPSIGVIIAKPTSTTADVLMYGEYDGASSLVKGKKVFLSSSGVFTSTPPLTNYVQSLGFAISATKLFINPEYVRVKRG